jgi:hypothetical protein
MKDTRASTQKMLVAFSPGSRKKNSRGRVEIVGQRRAHRALRVHQPEGQKEDTKSVPMLAKEDSIATQPPSQPGATTDKRDSARGGPHAQHKRQVRDGDGNCKAQVKTG